MSGRHPAREDELLAFRSALLGQMREYRLHVASCRERREAADRKLEETERKLRGQINRHVDGYNREARVLGLEVIDDAL